MTPPISSPTYLHGFSGTEQQRLMTQARLLESSIFGQIDYRARGACWKSAVASVRRPRSCCAASPSCT